jgi:hypothetical protein
MCPYIHAAFVISLCAASVEYQLKAAKNKQDEEGYGSLFNPTTAQENTSIKTKKSTNKYEMNGVLNRLWNKFGVGSCSLQGTPVTIAIWLMKYTAVIFLGIYIHTYICIYVCIFIRFSLFMSISLLYSL